MSLLARWTLGSAVRAIDEALASARPLAGAVAVVDHPPLAALIGERHPVLTLAVRGRPLRRARGRAARSTATALPFIDAGLAAIVGYGAGERPDWEPLLAEWSRAVRDGGAVILIDRAPREELTRRLLAAGLAELEQRTAGRLIITSGRVRKLWGRS